MKIAQNQLISHLKSPQQKSLYLIASDEPVLLMQTSEKIYRHFYAQGFHERFIITPTQDNAFEKLHDLLSQGLLFASDLFIELRLPDNKCPDKILPLLVEFGKNPPPSRVLLIVFGKLDSALQKAKWFTQLEQQGIFIPLWAPRSNEYMAWLKSYAQEKQVVLSQEELSTLTELTQGNLIAGTQTIEKLSFLPQAQGINRIRDALADTSQFDLFDLCDAILIQSPDTVLRILSRLKAQHTEPVLILWAITRLVRELLQFSDLMFTGESLPEILQKFHVLNHRRPLLSRYLSKPPISRLENALRVSAVIDKIIKGLVAYDVWMALEQLCLLLIGIQVSLLALAHEEHVT